LSLRAKRGNRPRTKSFGCRADAIAATLLNAQHARNDRRLQQLIAY